MQALSKEDKIYCKTQGICILCGKKVHKPRSNINGHTQMKGRRSFTIEHYFPQAIYKWVERPNLKSQIKHLDNLFIVHQQCNVNKDSHIPTKHHIHRLYAHQDIKHQLEQLYERLLDDINAYNALKKSVWSKQNKQCFFCDKSITFVQATLRRLDNNLKRIKENAICICSKCNIRAGSRQGRIRLLKQKGIVL